ncbi:MAG: serine/threonine-protein phosphatase [Gammaproteobacteria bacterium]|nr:serine/threonine-protein phosphatase [Gammaproteobacteria bacterium]
MQYIAHQVSRVGNREKNQDRTTIIEKDDCVLLVLGDGLGGRPGGELAAQVLIDSVTEDFNKQSFPIENPNKLLNELVINAHQAIMSAGKNQSPPITPGTTAVICLLQNESLWWTHVGDSRFYLFRGLKLELRSQDHSVVENLVQGGQLNAENLNDHPLRNVVTRCLGMTDNTPIPTVNKEIRLKIGDIVMLCSDGLWEPLSENQLSKTIYQGKLSDALSDLAETAEKINHPESDNVSAIALQIMSLQLKNRPGVIHKPII